MDLKRKQSEIYAQRPSLTFALISLLTFLIYACWHILIGKKLGDFLPSIPGRLPSNDPVRSLYDVFESSFVMGFMAVFSATMALNACVLFIKKNFPRIKPGSWIIFLLFGLVGFAADIYIIYILEINHGPWRCCFWQDIQSEWQSVSITTAIVAMSGSIAAVMIGYSFFSVGKQGEAWQGKFLLSTAWWVMIIAVSISYANSHFANYTLSDYHTPWWTNYLILLTFFLVQSIPFWLILRRFYIKNRISNLLLVFCMPLLTFFGFVAIAITWLHNVLWNFPQL